MRSYCKGFTLLELVITLVIAAILMSIAIPSFTELMQRSSQTSSYNALIGQINYARAEAVKRGVVVSICPSTDGTACNSAAWEDGVLVFTDTDTDGDYEAGDSLLKVFPGAATDIAITSVAFADTGAISFAGDGSLANVDGAGLIDTGTLLVCGPRGDTAATGINISLMGQSQKSVDTDANGIVNDVDGSDISC